jgi:hypothetical protein
MVKRCPETLLVVVALLVSVSPAVSQPSSAPSPQVTITLIDGSQLTGAVQSENKTAVTIIQTNSQMQVVQISQIVSCVMVAPRVHSISVGGSHCTPVVSDIHYDGFQSASVSVGYTGSAQRDESAKGTVELAYYQRLDTQKFKGSFRGDTLLNLAASYDDKWKSTPNSSNVTQVYQGLLQQRIYTRRTPQSQCGTDNLPLAYQITASAYRNNSQGIQVDQSYGFGVLKSFVVVKSKGTPGEGCSRPYDQFAQRISLSADVRSVNYLLYSPGGTDHGVGTQLQIGYSRMFPSRQAVGLTIGGVPVYNRSAMSQAAGDLIYAVPASALWAITFNVQDEYYEIAPKTFNKNYVTFSVGLKFTSPRITSTK